MSGRFIRWQRIAQDLELSRAAAYELMHRLNAVRIGRCLRLSEDTYKRYIAELTRESRVSWLEQAGARAEREPEPTEPANQQAREPEPPPARTRRQQSAPSDRVRALVEQACARAERLGRKRRGQP